jgi:hypothetical protein
VVTPARNATGSDRVRHYDGSRTEYGSLVDVPSRPVPGRKAQHPAQSANDVGVGAGLPPLTPGVPRSAGRDTTAGPVAPAE